MSQPFYLDHAGSQNDLEHFCIYEKTFPGDEQRHGDLHLHRELSRGSRDESLLRLFLSGHAALLGIVGGLRSDLHASLCLRPGVPWQKVGFFPVSFWLNHLERLKECSFQVQPRDVRGSRLKKRVKREKLVV